MLAEHDLIQNVALPADVGGLIAHAEQLHDDGLTEQALVVLHEAVQADPTPASRIALAVLLAERQPREALEELEHAWDQSRRLGCPRFCALCCGNLAVLCLRLGDVDQSARYRQHALSAQMQLVERDPGGGLPSDALIDLAVQWLCSPGESDGAESLLNAAAAENCDTLQQATIAAHRGVIAARDGRFEDALVQWSLAQRQFREVGEIAGVAHTMVNLGHLLQQQRRPAIARRAFTIARDLFDEQHLPSRAAVAAGFAREAAGHARLVEGEPAWN